MINIGLKNFKENPIGPILLIVFIAASMITFELGTIEFMEIKIDEHAHYIALITLMAGYVESGGQDIMKLQNYQLATIAATPIMLIGIKHIEQISNLIFSDPLFTMAGFLTTILGYVFTTMGE
ncbi:putative membrane protein [Methanonatronarchaeum thermophilum]|uniref:Putative membrane protein n=1 Tax=Methanonatronarchaeum thermophilum TaxID=1927129 RepID=A0A1Y3GE77_9EURY|nr:hypothetical protein [Methanonatronarchaeum thermophilum]OUJ18603.1 putative membrane protein [Methanonatronarchaeum thermophilum]